MDLYVQLARNTIGCYIREGQVYRPFAEELTEEMRSSRAGAFVSIHKHGALRGCIGTIEPVRKNLAQEIIFNAISASTRDPRFEPIGEEELDQLEISVDVLTTPQPISSETELDVRRYGVIVEKGYRRGLLLPDLEGVDNVAYQVCIAKRKAGIREDEQGVCLYRFEVIRHEQ
jgi:AmmeMemoRadiSam system protein A